MRRNALLLLCAVIAACLIASLFHGDKKLAWSIQTTNLLAIATPCASAVTINADPALRGQVDIIATARDKSEITQLQSHGGASALLSGAGSHCLGASACLETQSVCAGMTDDPSLKLTISVPENIALSITEAQGTDYNIGSIAGPLTLNLSGSGDVHIAVATGPIDATLADSGDLDIDAAAVPSANLALNGDGDVNVSAGSLGTLTATLSHDGDLHVPETASAKLVLTGDGDVDIDQIHGNLNATLTGDGDLSVYSVSGDAVLSSSGDGDITIPRVAGHLTQNNTGDGDFKINGS